MLTWASMALKFSLEGDQLTAVVAPVSALGSVLRQSMSR